MATGVDASLQKLQKDPPAEIRRLTISLHQDTALGGSIQMCNASLCGFELALRNIACKTRQDFKRQRKGLGTIQDMTSKKASSQVRKAHRKQAKLSLKKQPFDRIFGAFAVVS